MRILMTALLLAGATMMLAQRDGNRLFEQALMKERSQGDWKGAIALYQRIVKEYGSDRKLASRALLEMARCQERQGAEQALQTYARLIQEYGDQAEVLAQAKGRMAALNGGAGSTAPRARQVWAGFDASDEGSISPDGQWLTYAHWETGDLGLRNLVTNTTKLLTNTGGWAKSKGVFAQDSVFSPDGKLIAYNWFVPPSSYELRVMNADGSGVRTLGWKDVPGYVVPGAWSPDGKLLVVKHWGQDSRNSLHVVTVATGEKREVPDLGSLYPNRIAFSPDGQWIAFDNQSRGGSDLYLLSVNGGKPELLDANPSRDLSPYWSKEGNHVYFLSDRSGEFGLWRVSVAGGKRTGQPELIRRSLGGEISPIGVTQSGSLTYSIPGGGPDVYVAGFDSMAGRPTGEPQLISDRHPRGNRLPVLSGNGRLVYLSQMRRSMRAVVRELGTGEDRLVTIPSNTVKVFWSGDGKRLLVEQRLTEPPDTRSLSWLDIESGAITPFRTFRPTRHGLNVELAPNGQTIYVSFVEWPSRVFSVLAVDAVSGEQKPVFTSSGVGPDKYRGAMRVSPDGRWLAATAEGEFGQPVTLVLIPVGGGEPRRVAKIPEVQLGVDCFSSDGKFVFLRKAVAGVAPVELLRVNVESGQVQPTGLRGPNLMSAQMTPDGRQVVYQAGTRDIEIWMADNVLPAGR